MKDANGRFRILGEFLHQAGSSQVLVDFVHRAMVNYLVTDLQYKERYALLGFLWNARDLFIPAVFPTPIMTAIARHIIEICQEWEWL